MSLATKRTSPTTSGAENPTPEAEALASGVRASSFTSAASLGSQRPRKLRSMRTQMGLVALYVGALALQIVTSTRPESLIGSWLAQSPQPLDLNALPTWLLAFLGTLIVAVGASYRPLGGLLGFGALPLPALALVIGAPLASFIGFLGAAGSAFVLRRLSKRDPKAPRDRRSSQRILFDASILGAATLIASVFWVVFSASSPLLAISGSALIWLAGAHGLNRWQRRSRSRHLTNSPRSTSSWPRFGILWDALGWTLAASLTLISSSVGTLALLPALIGYLALTIVGASRELDRASHLRRIRDLQNLGSMAQRLVPRERASELASQCLAEVNRTIDFSYFELRFESSDGIETFHCKARGPLLSGAAEIPDHPPAAPGIHARRDWLLIERDLLSRPSNDSAAEFAENPPLPDLTQRLGQLRVWIDPRNSNDEEEALISDLVPQIAALIDHSRLDREARLDALTGLARRHIFDREVSRRLELAQEEGHSVALLLFDLDHFKHINDSYGHDAGDRVLEAVSAILLRASDPGGLACRWGGEELALLQWGGGSNALRFAEELRHFIASQQVDTDAGRLQVTTSVGVVAFPDLLLSDPSEMIKLADEALYAAKENGRNQALLAMGRGRFQTADGQLLGDQGGLAPEEFPQL